MVEGRKRRGGRGEEERGWQRGGREGVVEGRKRGVGRGEEERGW